MYGTWPQFIKNSGYASASNVIKKKKKDIL